MTRNDPPTPAATTPGIDREQPAPRGSFRLLLDPAFGPFFVGKLLSTAGIWVHNIVAAILAYELSGSAFVVGMVSVAQFGPQLLFAPLSGALADRGDRRRQVILGRLIAAAGSGSLAIAIGVLGVDGLPGAWVVVLAALIVGIGFVVGGPAMNALIPSLVRPNELASAVALNSIPFTVARAGGPAVGALIATTTGPASAFALAAATNVVFALLLVPLRIETHARANGADRRVRAGLAYLREDRAIWLLLIGVAAIGVGADPVITLTPSLSAGFDAGATLVGVFASSFGVGAGLAFTVLGTLRRRLGLSRVATLGLGLLATGLLATAASPAPVFAVVSLGVGGAGMTLSLTSLSTQLQERLPDELRGRVMALWSVAFLGSRPIAAGLNGAVADATSPSLAFGVVGVIVAIAAWWCRPSAIAVRPVPAFSHVTGRSSV
jgi:MFS family permease